MSDLTWPDLTFSPCPPCFSLASASAALFFPSWPHVATMHTPLTANQAPASLVSAKYLESPPSPITILVFFPLNCIHLLCPPSVPWTEAPDGCLRLPGLSFQQTRLIVVPKNLNFHLTGVRWFWWKLREPFTSWDGMKAQVHRKVVCSFWQAPGHLSYHFPTRQRVLISWTKCSLQSML